MNRIQKLNAIQDKAVDALEEANFNGTLKMATGTGKGITLLKAFKRMYDNGILVKGDSVAILAEEVRARERTFFEQEIPKFKEIFEFDIDNILDIKLYHYNTFAKNDVIPKAVGLDEVDCIFSVERIKTFNKPIDYFIGLTGTTSDTSPVYRDKSEEGFRQSDFDTKLGKVTDFANKGQCFQIFCPIVYEYSMEQGIKDGILSDFRTTIITHNLGNNNVQITKNWVGTEKKYYDFWRTKALLPNTPEYFKVSILQQRLPRFLYSLPSKITLGKKILKHLQDRRVLIFSKELEFLRQLTPNVCEDYYLINGKKYNDLKEYKKKKNIKSSVRLKVGEYGIKTLVKVTPEEVLDRFDNGEINTIASSQRLQRGVTLKGLNTLLIFVSSKQYRALVQMLGKHNLLN